jgi:deoxyribodipyrimidine photo-lyase
VRLGVRAVYVNHDYEPTALDRDAAVDRALAAAKIELRTFKDQVIFEKDEVLTAAGTPYTVFTPYKRAWLKKLDRFHLQPYPVQKYVRSLAAPPDNRCPSLADLGFAPTNLREVPVSTGMSGAQHLLADFLDRIRAYHERRDYPAAKGPSYLSVHLRFGTVSIRELAARAYVEGGKGAETWLSELVWREFYFAVLHHFPHVVGHAFKRELEDVVFENDPGKWRAWCAGQTGYPLVDAAMRQIDRTGYMHNRLRMVAASFLVKDLHVDWRWGERYFADHLNDFDLAANNGGWQWAASTGCDAQPYFRIFNPVTQSRRFDPEGKFIRRYVPELARVPDRYVHAPWTMRPVDQEAAGCVIGRDYPAPVVDHDRARQLTLERYRRAAGKR